MAQSESNFEINMGRIVCGAVLLSTSAPWVRVADVDPTAAGVYRMVFGAVALFVVCAATGRRLWKSWRYFLKFAPVAAFFALDLILWHRCIHIVGPGLATILANLQVFVMAGVGAGWLGEKLGWKFPVGLTFALVGVWLLVGVDLSGVSSEYLYGVALGIGAALGYAGFLLGMRFAQMTDDTLTAPVNLMFATFWCAVLLSASVLVEGASFAVTGAYSWGALLAYGILVQVVGWLLITGAMPALPASLVGLSLLLQPSLAMVWDVAFFERPTGWLDAVGLALVLAGLYLASTQRHEDAEDVA